MDQQYYRKQHFRTILDAKFNFLLNLYLPTFDKSYLLSSKNKPLNKLEAASAFIGHGQAAAATACFIKVADALGQLFQLMETLGDRLKQYAKKYQEVGEGIASQLNSAQISVK